ncbi:MAG: hypothetical protein E7409_06775 [Ruminococcaceae bacterium]|nr:hypothetical protein [Oscillospiraceae bacterium]
MKIEDGKFTGTLDEFLEYMTSCYTKEYLKQIDREIANVELPADIEERKKEGLKEIHKRIREMEEGSNST